MFKQYKIKVHGKNLNINITSQNGCNKIIGFWTTCYIYAKDKETAIKRAIKKIKKDSKLQGHEGNLEKDLLIIIEKIEEVNFWSSFKISSGYTFYGVESNDSKC